MRKLLSLLMALVIVSSIIMSPGLKISAEDYSSLSIDASVSSTPFDGTAYHPGEIIDFKIVINNPNGMNLENASVYYKSNNKSECIEVLDRRFDYSSITITFNEKLRFSQDEMSDSGAKIISFQLKIDGDTICYDVTSVFVSKQIIPINPKNIRIDTPLSPYDNEYLEGYSEGEFVVLKPIIQNINATALYLSHCRVMVVGGNFVLEDNLHIATEYVGANAPYQFWYDYFITSEDVERGYVDFVISAYLVDYSNMHPYEITKTIRVQTLSEPGTPNELREDPVDYEEYLPEVDYSGISSFVDRLFRVALNRAPDDEGKLNWVNTLSNGLETGGAAARFFCLGQEMTNRNLSNEDYVEILYNLFFGRQSDAVGKADWVGRLNAGATRESILDGFINSVEWANICFSYGIESGGNAIANVSPNENVVDFTRRLYSTCLGREPDSKGLDYWGREISNRRQSSTNVAYGFFFSQEFIEANYTNEEYIERLYLAFMDRPSDEQGRNDWLNRLNSGTSREEVFYGFANSVEFSELCSSYGIYN